MRNERLHATIMTDLSFGDAGKGTSTEYFAGKSDSAVVIRFNGGGQAEHNIVTPDGRHHVFSQFGAGAFLPNVATHLSRDMWVNPITMNYEAEHLDELQVPEIWSRVTVDEHARIVTPYHRAGNRLRELARGASRHGSTGHGISEAVMDDMFRPDLTIRAGELASSHIIERLEALRRYKVDQLSAFGQLLDSDTPDWEALNTPALSVEYADTYTQWRNKLRIVSPHHLAQLALEYSHLIFEPAQGILLDEKRGFHPHTTWSNTTPDNARRQLTEIGFTGDLKTYGIIRAYTTRHGFGPFVTEDVELDGQIPEYFNGTGPWQGKFRIGHFDPIAHRYAARAAGHLDGLIVTGVDRVADKAEWKYATGYTVPDTPDASKYFVSDDHGRVTDIALGPYGHKGYMTRLTELMFQAKPHYEVLDWPTREEVLQRIEQQMGIRLVLASFGPTIDDKVELDNTIESIEAA